MLSVFSSHRYGSATLIPKKEEVSDEIFGIKVADPYRWLENTESTNVQTWLDEQNNYTRSSLDEIPGREKLRKEFEHLFREETIGFPIPKNGRYFYIKRKANEDIGVLYVKKGLIGEPRVLVDPNIISKEKGSAVNLAGYSISEDGAFITYRLSEAANDMASLYVINVETGEKLQDVIPGEFYPTTGSWAVDNTGFWYTRRKDGTPKGEEKFHKKVFYHKLGTPFSDDELVFGESFAKEDYVGASVTHGGRYLKAGVSISSEAYRRGEVYLLDLANPQAGFVPIVKDIKGDEDIFFQVVIHRDFAYVLSNFKAPKWKIERVAIPDIQKGMEAWEVVIPEDKDRTIEDLVLAGEKLFVLTLENVYSVLREYSLEGEITREIPLPTLGTVNRALAEPEGKEGFFSFDSFAYPDTVFRIDFNTDVVSVYEKQKITVDTSDFVSEQVWCTSKDGTRVPMFLVYKKGLAINGNAPTVMYGYGGFNISKTPSFMKHIIPFIERGGLYVIANIRGGGEFGEEWHKAGTKRQKQNVFDDFISVAKWLIENNYTNSNRLAIAGGSNGGLLVGAVMTQRPELFRAVVMSVPVADMLRYHLFHGGRHWIPDYGSAEDEDMFPYLLAYSPYHNVKDGTPYPSTIIITADQDDRVHPGQAFKMAARLQETNISTNPILLRVERKAGHGGAVDVSRYINKAVDEWSFVFKELGM